VLINLVEDDFYFKSQFTLNESKAKEVIRKVIEQLSLSGDGILETLKLQVLYELAHINEEDKVEQITKYFETEIHALIKEITSYQNSTKKDYDSIQIHKKIFSFLLIKTKQNTLNSLNNFNNNNNIGISSERELYAILDNVLPKSGLPPFVTLSSHDKIAQLNDLCNIIMGIRLYNAEVGKGGIGLMTFSDLKNHFTSDLLNSVNEYHLKISRMCEKYTTIYERTDFSLVVESDLLEKLEQIRKLIIYFRQILTYLSTLRDDLNNSITLINNLLQGYEKEIKMINEIVDKKLAITKEQVYPRFENLAKMYSKFQEQSFILNIRENVFTKLQSFAEENPISASLLKDDIVAPFTWLLEQSRIDREENQMNFESGMYQNGVNILLPHSTIDFYETKLDYEGFCIVSIIKREGLLVNGTPNLIAKYKDKNLVFSSMKKVQDFIEEPDVFIESINNYVKKHPYLINLLNMTEEYPMANLSVLFRDKDLYTFKYKSSCIQVDKTIQTDVHLHEEGFIDKDYVWNEWDLKKKAIQLADIMRKKTVSCQTILSHYRRENESQLYPLKEQAINTTVSKATNLSISKAYISDLRKNDAKY
jgi:hypothetical protein